MAIDPKQLASDFMCLSPDEFLDQYAAGRRDFKGVNLLREYIEPLADRIGSWYKKPTQGGRYGYWKESVSPLWMDKFQGDYWDYDAGSVFKWFLTSLNVS